MDALNQSWVEPDLTKPSMYFHALIKVFKALWIWLNWAVNPTSWGWSWLNTVAEPRGCGRMSSRWLQSDLRVQRYGSSESKDRFFQSWLSNFWKTLCSCSSPTLAYIVGWCLTCKWTYTALYFSMYPIQTKKRIGLEILHRPQSNLDLSLRSPSGSSCERLVSRWVYLKGCWSVWTFF